MSQGISALTCWVLVHFFFIFGAIVVYGSQLVILRWEHFQSFHLIVGIMDNYGRLRRFMDSIWYLLNRFVEEDAGQLWEDGGKSRSIDRTMLMCFVTLYLLFNCIYWPVCLLHWILWLSNKHIPRGGFIIKEWSYTASSQDVLGCTSLPTLRFPSGNIQAVVRVPFSHWWPCWERF